jgi:hypothetical protein
LTLHIIALYLCTTDNTIQLVELFVEQEQSNSICIQCSTTRMNHFANQSVGNRAIVVEKEGFLDLQYGYQCFQATILITNCLVIKYFA